MSRKHIHIAQACYFLPLLEELEQCGVNTEKLIKVAGLNRFAIDSPINYAPVSFVYQLFMEIKNIGCDDFLHQFNKVLQVQSLQQYGEIICFAPDVYEGCLLSEKYNEFILSNERVCIDVFGNKTVYKIWFTNKPKPGWEEAELVTLALTINGLRIGGGKEWNPDEIHLRSNKMPNLETLFPSNNTIVIKLNQPVTKIIFHTGLLAKPMLNGIDNKNHINSLSLSSDVSNATKISHLIKSSVIGSIPSLAQIASYSDTSISSVKRMLKVEGYTYKHLVENWRFKKSIGLLENSSLQIKEIAQILGYANSSNFERAFKRWTKTTPQKYHLAL